MGARLEQARRFFAGIPKRELSALAGAMALGAAVVIAYVLATRPNELLGDQIEYHSEGVFFTQGKPWWSTLPFGIAHASTWKAPVYPAWVGFWYELLGNSPVRVAIVQGLILAPLSVLATWLLGRRLFGARVALAAAFVVAVFPLAWEFFGLLYAEALAVPLTTLIFFLFLDRAPSRGLAIGVGAAIGLAMLVRPTSFFLFAGLLATWVILAGWRRGIGHTAIAVAVAALVVIPWTIRNAVVTDGGFVPISIQDGAAFGTFNEESASDPVYPYAWRFRLEDPPEVMEGPPVEDDVFRSELQDAAFDYISEHPESVPKAFFWNGLSRFWDVRRPARAVDEVAFDGRSEAMTWIGLAMYYVLLPLALLGLWRMRARRALVVPILVTALAASVVFTVQGATRYRAPLEPLIVVLAAAAIPALSARRGVGPREEESPPPRPPWVPTAEPPGR